MSTDVINMICRMDVNKLESQLALQCAPLIVGLKISNLFVTERRYIRLIRQMLCDSEISFYVLTLNGEKATLLLYRPIELTSFLRKKRVRDFLNKEGYGEHWNLTEGLFEFRKRYAAYQSGLSDFPHEMGVFLGYPIEDVEGFIENDGADYLYSGYWKVYENVAAKKELFELYEIAKETLVRMVSGGVSIAEIIECYAWRQAS